MTRLATRISTGISNLGRRHRPAPGEVWSITYTNIFDQGQVPSSSDNTSSSSVSPSEPAPPYTLENSGPTAAPADLTLPIVAGLDGVATAVRELLVEAIAYVIPGNDAVLKDGVRKSLVSYILGFSEIRTRRHAEYAMETMEKVMATATNTVTSMSTQCPQSVFSVWRLACHTACMEAEKDLPLLYRRHISKLARKTGIILGNAMSSIRRPQRFSFGTKLASAMAQLGRAIVDAPPPIKQKIIREYMYHIEAMAKRW